MSNMIEKVAAVIGHQPDCPVYNRRDEPPYKEPGPCDCGSDVKAADALEASSHHRLVATLKLAMDPYEKTTRNPDGFPVGEPSWVSQARVVLKEMGALS